jgi:hypothetical protein
MKLPASQYVDFMATSIQNTLNDETLFPTKAGKVFRVSYEKDFTKLIDGFPLVVQVVNFHENYP